MWNVLLIPWTWKTLWIHPMKISIWRGSQRAGGVRCYIPVTASLDQDPYIQRLCHRWRRSKYVNVRVFPTLATSHRIRRDSLTEQQQLFNMAAQELKSSATLQIQTAGCLEYWELRMQPELGRCCAYLDGCRDSFLSLSLFSWVSIFCYSSWDVIIRKSMHYYSIHYSVNFVTKQGKPNPTHFKKQRTFSFLKDFTLKIGQHSFLTHISQKLSTWP